LLLTKTAQLLKEHVGEDLTHMFVRGPDSSDIMHFHTKQAAALVRSMRVAVLGQDAPPPEEEVEAVPSPAPGAAHDAVGLLDRVVTTDASDATHLGGEAAAYDDITHVQKLGDVTAREGGGGGGGRATLPPRAQLQHQRLAPSPAAVTPPVPLRGGGGGGSNLLCIDALTEDSAGTVKTCEWR
jgi:hypothetical protein